MENTTDFAGASLLPAMDMVMMEERLNGVPLPRTSPNSPTQGKLLYCNVLDLLAGVLSGTSCASEAKPLSNSVLLGKPQNSLSLSLQTLRAV